MGLMPTFAPYTPAAAADLNTIGAQVNALQIAQFGAVTRTKVPSCFLALTAYRNVLTGTRLLNWDTPVFDTNSMWSAGTPSIIAINTPGQWLIAMQLVYTPNGTGHRWGFVTVNGTNVQTNSILFAGGTGVGQSASGTVPAQLAQGDLLRCYSDQDSGVTLQMQHDYGGTKFGAIWIGP